MSILDDRELRGLGGELRKLIHENDGRFKIQAGPDGQVHISSLLNIMSVTASKVIGLQTDMIYLSCVLRAMSEQLDAPTTQSVLDAAKGYLHDQYHLLQDAYAKAAEEAAKPKIITPNGTPRF